MATPTLGDAEFLFAWCAACDKDVLTHIVDFADDRSEIRRCVHCDGGVGDDWQPVTADALVSRGYDLIEARGCGNGGGCGSGCGLRARS